MSGLFNLALPPRVLVVAYGPLLDAFAAEAGLAVPDLALMDLIPADLALADLARPDLALPAGPIAVVLWPELDLFAGLNALAAGLVECGELKFGLRLLGFNAPVTLLRPTGGSADDVLLFDVDGIADGALAEEPPVVPDLVEECLVASLVDLENNARVEDARLQTPRVNGLIAYAEWAVSLELPVDPVFAEEILAEDVFAEDDRADGWTLVDGRIPADDGSGPSGLILRTMTRCVVMGSALSLSRTLITRDFVRNMWTLTDNGLKVDLADIAVIAAEVTPLEVPALGAEALAIAPLEADASRAVCNVLDLANLWH